MKKIRALVFGSGGSRGALQAGAVRALHEIGYIPDLMTGASIGAANAAFLAINGFTSSGINKLQHVWELMAEKDLMRSNLWWQFMRRLFRKTGGDSQDLISEFAITHGITPDLKFGDLRGIRFYPVASDLDEGIPMVFGKNPDESVLEGVMASMALPPWMAPVERDGHLLMDGGAVSNLPVEAALLAGADEIVALDLSDPQDRNIKTRNIKHFLIKLDHTVEFRHKTLELELAEASGVPVRHISLIGEMPVPFWNFRDSRVLMERGYQITKRAMEQISLSEPRRWVNAVSLHDMRPDQ